MPAAHRRQNCHLRNYRRPHHHRRRLHHHHRRHHRPDPNHVWCTLAKASPKGTNPGKNGLRQRVIKLALSLHRGGAPIDNRLFARVAETLSIPAETAKSIFYDKASKNLLHRLGGGLIFWDL